MQKKIFPIIFLSLFLLFGLLLNMRSNKSTTTNIGLKLGGKISFYKDGYRGGAFITLDYEQKIYTNAFTGCIDSIRINDSISKIAGSYYISYCKFDVEKNNYVFIDSCNCTILKVIN
jgi:hypothetical protein